MIVKEAMGAFGPPWRLSQADLGDVTPGASFNWTVPFGFFIHLLTVRFRLVTDITNVNRQVVLACNQPGEPSIPIGVAEVVQGPSASIVYIASSGVVASTNIAHPVIAFPITGVVLPSNSVVSIFVVNMQAGDWIREVRIRYELLPHA